MENETITLRDIIEFMENNYIHNIWNRGLSDLVKIFPDKLKKALKSSHPTFSKAIFRKKSLGGNQQCLNIYFAYNGGWGYSIDVLKTCYGFYLLPSYFNLEEKQKIMERVDFSHIYNYFMENDFPDYYLGINSQNELGAGCNFDGTYNNGDAKKINISVSYSCVAICSAPSKEKNPLWFYKYNYYMSNDRLMVEEIVESKINYEPKMLVTNEPDYELKKLMANDPNFLDNVTIEFKKSPIWLQDLYNANKFDKDDKEEKMDNYFKRILKKII